MNLIADREKELAKTYKAGIYCRLSKADGEGESESIKNQKQLLSDFCNKRGWTITKIYEDDGFSGLKADRPKLKELLSDVEAGTINLVITKDYSRLGRDRLHTEELRENFFPRHKCRYIAILDRYDSLYTETEDIMPFKSILNEMYSRDISKKVHSTYKTHAEQGLYTGTVPPLGYLKNPEKKGHLIIDPETEPIIREIFKMALQGHGPNYICRRLEELKIPCPSYWNRIRGYRNTLTKWELNDPEAGKYIWDFSAVKSILQNPVYIGTIASQKCDYRFKLGVIAEKPPEQWIQVEGCHDAIITKADYRAVQSLTAGRKREGNNETYNIFAGLLKCGDCGKSMNLKRTNSKERKLIFNCKTYSTHGKKYCSQHRIDYDVLYNAVLSDIKKLIAEALSTETEDLANEVQAKYNKGKQQKINDIKRKITKAQSRQETAEAQLLKLYEDNINGKISDMMLERLTAKLNAEMEALQKQIKELEEQLEAEKQGKKQRQEFLNIIEQYRDIDILTPELLHLLISSIYVFQTTENMRIQIDYRIKPL